jgi:raffinose/stachyose/melibiose transport system substrate-binding protein
MIKKAIAILALAVLCGSVFSLDKNATIVVMAPQDQVMDAERALAERFTKETGIKVDFQIYPSDQWVTLLQTKLNSGECGDIFMDQDGALDIGPRYDIQKNGVDLSKEPWVKSLDPTVLSAATLNGKVYGLPLWDTYNIWDYVYNKKIFSKLGLVVPKTYAQFKDACEKIKAAGITPIYESCADGWHHQLPFLEMGCRLNELHPGLYDQLNANKVKLADVPEARQLLEQILETSKSYYGDNYLSNQYANTPVAMASGKYAMCMYSWGEIVAASKESGMTADDFGVFVMPFMDNRTLNVNPSGPTHFVYSRGKHIEEAKAYLAFLTKKGNAQFYLDNIDRFNRLSVTGLKYKQNGSTTGLADVKKSGVVMQSAVTYTNTQWMDIGKDMVAMFTGQMTPKQVLESLDKRRAEQAIAQKDPRWAK